MRLSMSAIGSVSIPCLLPARLRHARNHALVRQLAQADPAEAELLEHGARAPAAVAPRVIPHLELLRLLLLHNERLPRHLLIPPVVAAERQAESLQQRTSVFVGLGGSRDRHVEPADLLNVVVVDLRKDDLLAHTERVVAAAVERVGVEAPEVADARQRDRDEPVEELVHLGAAQRHAGPDGHPLAELEARDRLAGAPDLGVLARDRGELLDRGVHRLGVRLRVADAHVERDLRHLRDAHDRVELELVLEGRPDLVVVALLQAREICLGRGRHQLTTSSLQRLQKRTRTVSPLISLTCTPRRVACLQVGHTNMTFEISIADGFSKMPPGVICAPPMRDWSRIGCGLRWRLTRLRFSTMTRPSLGRASITRP